MDTVQKQDKEYIAGTYARFPLTVEGGKGSVVWDNAGKVYIDLSSGIAVNTFGAADDEWIKAVTEQAGKLQHMSNLYYTEPCVKLAKMLCERTGMSKVFFSNSGAEANECAIKAARKYAAEKHGADCYNIVTLKNSFHGRTITTLAATGQDAFHKDFLPLTEGFIYVEPNDTEKSQRFSSSAAAQQSCSRSCRARAEWCRLTRTISSRSKGYAAIVTFCLSATRFRQATAEAVSSTAI